jgi:polysaccharide export outer membrane protein
MRHARFIILVVATLVANGCARKPPRPIAAAPPPNSLDAIAYGRHPLAIPAAVPVPPAHPPVVAAVPAPPPVSARPPVIAVSAPPPAPEYFDAPYTLDSGDKLRVMVFGQDGLTNSYAVDAAGSITMPLIGAVPARGRTTAELSGAIAGRLRDGYLREPHVAVEVEAYRPFFILGEVTYPGQYPYVANMTVETAVAIAGGYSPRAFRKSVDLSRPTVQGPVRYKAPVTAQVRPGDTVVVAERWF